jgi:hypothetical protein
VGYRAGSGVAESIRGAGLGEGYSYGDEPEWLSSAYASGSPRFRAMVDEFRGSVGWRQRVTDPIGDATRRLALEQGAREAQARAVRKAREKEQKGERIAAALTVATFAAPLFAPVVPVPGIEMAYGALAPLQLPAAISSAGYQTFRYGLPGSGAEPGPVSSLPGLRGLGAYAPSSAETYYRSLRSNPGTKSDLRRLIDEFLASRDAERTAAPPAPKPEKLPEVDPTVELLSNVFAPWTMWSRGGVFGPKRKRGVSGLGQDPWSAVIGAISGAVGQVAQAVPAAGVVFGARGAREQQEIQREAIEAQREVALATLRSEEASAAARTAQWVDVAKKAIPWVGGAAVVAGLAYGASKIVAARRSNPRRRRRLLAGVL